MSKTGETPKNRHMFMNSYYGVYAVFFFFFVITQNTKKNKLETTIKYYKKSKILQIKIKYYKKNYLKKAIN